MSPFEFKSCLRKKKFRRRKWALTAMAVTTKMHPEREYSGASSTVYKCVFCRRWHFGHSPWLASKGQIAS